MKNVLKASFLVVIGFLVGSVPLFAHHGNAAYETKTVTMKGTVTAWVWINPHVFLKFDVKDDKGDVVNWAGELVAPSNLVNSGFTKDTFKPGDQVTVTADFVAKSGAPVCRVSQIILANGQVMKMSGGNDGSRNYGTH